MSEIIQYSLILLYGLILVSVLPAFVRLVTNRPKVFDAIKACCALLAASFVNGFFVREETGVTLYDANQDVWRTVSAVITGAIFVTLIVVISKTEKAMRCGKS